MPNEELKIASLPIRKLPLILVEDLFNKTEEERDKQIEILNIGFKQKNTRY